MKKYGVIVTILSIVALLTGCISIPLGDGQKLKLSKDEITITDKEGDEHKVAIDKDGESINITGTDGDGEEGSFSVSGGGSVDLPETFPAEIPLPSDANIYQATEANSLISVMLRTKLPTDELLSMYEAYAKEADINNEPGSNLVEQDGQTHTTYGVEASYGKVQIQVMSSEEEEEKVIIIVTETADEQTD